MATTDDPGDTDSRESRTEKHEPASLLEVVQAYTGGTLDVKVDLRMALLGGLIAAAVALIGTLSMGTLSGVKGSLLLQAMMPSFRFLCFAAISASATTLALMLTLLGLSRNSGTTLRATHYQRIKQIAFFDLVVFVMGDLFLLLFTIPFQETATFPVAWYDTIYYVTITMASVLGGLMVTVMLMLFNALRDIIDVMGMGITDHPMVLKGEPPPDDAEISE